MQFYQLAIGARFEFCGKAYTKTGMNMTEDEQQRIGCVFLGGTEVTPIGEPLLLPEAEAEKWKPFDLWACPLTSPPPPASGEMRPPESA